MRKPLPETQVLFDAFPLQGGLDLHTPQLSLKPGVARAAENFECSINGGYSRVPGYERYDGRTAPSAAIYGTLSVTITGALAVADAVNGQTSGATAVVCAIDGDTVAYTKATGTFVAGENLRVGVTVVGVIDDAALQVTNQTEAATFQLAASDIYRADIQAVPGSGPVRGLFTWAGSQYAVRDNAAATAAELWRATPTGWVAVSFHYELAFTAGSVEPAEGASITQGAVSAVVRRVVIEDGAFLGGTAAGRFIIDAPTGGNFVAGALTAGATATISGAQTAITLLPGGRYETDIGDAGNGRRLYGCDGVNRGFEFDGTVWVPINSGQPSDTPTHVRVYKLHLFYSFASSAQHSNIGAPYGWTAVGGAAELSVGEDISGFLVLPGNTDGGALAIFSSSKVSTLYGSGTSTWNLVETNSGDGAKAYSAQTLAQSYYFGDLGVVGLQAVQAYGNFTSNTLTSNLRQFVQARRALVTESLVNREKSQYRIYFSDGYGLYTTLVNGRYIGAMPVLFPNAVRVACKGASANGDEVSYFGSDNGFVYQMDVGTSFDGAAITASLELSFASQGNSRLLKRYRKAVFELQGEGYSEFDAGYSLAYADEDRVQAPAQTTVSTNVSPAFWDSFVWDAFIWDGRALAPAHISMEGTAENVSMRIEQDSALWPAYTINSVTLHYTPRRILR